MDFTSGPNTLDVRRLQLLRDGTAVQTEPQVFALLRHLVEDRDRVVSRDEMFEVKSRDRIVSDATLSSRTKLPAAIGDSGAKQAMVRTVHGHGVQFVGKVDENKTSLSTDPQTLVMNEGASGERSAPFDAPLSAPAAHCFSTETAWSGTSLKSQK